MKQDGTTGDPFRAPPRDDRIMASRATFHHAVQFYDDDAFLCDRIAEFTASGLAAGDPVVLIAMPAHRLAVRERLASRGLDVSHATACGNIVWLDARETLAMFMVDNAPDAARFLAVMDSVIANCRAGRSHTTVRAYGEMVDLLWRDGNPTASLALEELWNEFGRDQDLSLLCAYVMGNFYSEDDRTAFEHVCDAHRKVIPAEGYFGIADPDDRLREISLLQQRARALESEIVRRREIERLLREALEARETADAENARLFEMAERERARAEAANRAKDLFIGTLSHELRTPLNAILGWTRMLRSGALPESKREHALETIDRNARAQTALIEDLLDVNRIVTGKMRLDTARVETASVVATALESVRPAADAKRVKLDVSLDPDAGGLDGDAVRLQQIAWNLLSNAVKFTPSGGAVRVELRAIEGQHELVVSDDGQGIEPSLLPHVFERFIQGDSTSTREHTGLGLGLALAKHLVELHGGTIRAESAGTGKGATFTVRLPIARAHAATSRGLDTH